MKAAVCRAFGEPLVIEDLTIDPPMPDEVLVDIKACAICASDLHAASGAWGGVLPVVHGHEASGVVATVGSDVTSVEVGDRVVVSLIRSCHDCFYCNRGLPHMCERRGDFDIATSNRLHRHDGDDVAQGVYTGAFAEQAVVHHSQLARLDDDVPFEVGALLACGVMTGFGAVANTVDLERGSKVAVIGAGGVGLNSIQAARIEDASQIIAVDVSDEKLHDARLFGATDVVDVSDLDPVEVVRGLTDGRGPDYVFVTVGSTAAIEQALDMVRNAGTVVVVGMTRTGAHAQIETSGFAGNAKRIVGSFMGSSDLRRDIPRLVELYRAGELMLDELVTATYSLDEINDAIESTASGQVRRNVVLIGS